MTQNKEMDKGIFNSNYKNDVYCVFVSAPWKAIKFRFWNLLDFTKNNNFRHKLDITDHL